MSRLAEAPSFGQSIFENADDLHGAADYLALREELLDCHRVRRLPDPVKPPALVTAASTYDFLY